MSEFRATREVPRGQSPSETITLTVHIKLKNGVELDIDAPQGHPDGTHYLVLTKGRYRPEDVGSFWITAKALNEQPAISTSDLAKSQAAVDAQMKKLNAQAAEINAFIAEETAKQRTTCAALYTATSDKKAGDLTVDETKQIQACSADGMYPPD